MPNGKLSFTQQLEQLKKEYIAHLPNRMQEIETAWQDYSNNGWNNSANKQLSFNIHRLAGSGATFGFPKLSEQAHNIEKLLKPILQSGSQPTKIESAELYEQITVKIF